MASAISNLGIGSREFGFRVQGLVSTPYKV